MSTYKRKNTHKQSLTALMAAVSAQLAATPANVVRMPVNIAEAFLLVDGVLSLIHRQLCDARVNRDKIAAMLGDANAPMMEALNFQITALEQAYAERLAALTRKREEGRKNLTPKKDLTALEGENLLDVRQQAAQKKQEKDSLWSWLIFMLLISQSSITIPNGPRLQAA
jgi:hypothetical protein